MEDEISMNTWNVSPPLAHSSEAVVLFGILFHNVTFDDAIAWAVARMHSGKPAVIATVNVDFMMQAWADKELHETLLEADLVLADGAPIVWLSKKFGAGLKQRVTGSDLTPLLAKECAREDFKIFLLGGAPGVAEKAGEVLRNQTPGLRIAGTHSPPVCMLSEMNHEDILQQLNDVEPHLLLVAFGAPKQEKFIRRNLPFWRVPIAIGVGGTLDFLAGVQWRAPQIIQKMGLEWLWRLSTDPRRLLRRYYGNALFLASALIRLLFLRAHCKFNSPRRPFCSKRLSYLFKSAPAQLLELQDLALLSPPMERGHWAVINLSSRSWLDSRELAVLVLSARAFKKAGGEFSVLCPSGPLQKMLRSCHLDRFIHLFPDAQTALNRINEAVPETADCL